MKTMRIVGRSLAYAAVAFLCALAGFYTHAHLPAEAAQSVDLIRGVTALIGALFAIVLGLLVSSSYASFNSHQADFDSLVTTVANIDLLLKHFPAESDPPRLLLKKMVLRVLGRYWPGKRGGAGVVVSYRDLSSDVADILEINHASERFASIVRDDLNAIRDYSSKFVTIQSNIIRSLSNQMPSFLLVIVFSWACLLFFLYGCLCPGNVLAVFFLFLGAIAIASANFLIAELTNPYQGMFTVSSTAFELLLHSLIDVAESEAAGDHSPGRPQAAPA